MTNIKDTLLNLQYQYSKLFVLGLPRKRFECYSTADGLKAVNTSKNTLLAIAFTFFSCGLLFTGIIEGVMNKKEISLSFIATFFLIHPLIGLIGLRQFLWLTNGVQELEISNDKLILTKRGTFWTKPKEYDLEEVNNIRTGVCEEELTLFEKIKHNIALNRKVLFTHTIGQVLFDYNNKTVNVFNDLNESEREQLLTEIKKNTNTQQSA